MRFKLTLQLQSEVMGNQIPINYQYPIQSAIYSILANSDIDINKKESDLSYSHSPTS